LVVVFFVVASVNATPPNVGIGFIFIAGFKKPRIDCSLRRSKKYSASSTGKSLRVNNGFYVTGSLEQRNCAFH